jgi:GTP-binding protein HflX
LPRAAAPERTAAVLVGVDLGLPHFDGELQELGLLAETAGLDGRWRA